MIMPNTAFSDPFKKSRAGDERGLHVFDTHDFFRRVTDAAWAAQKQHG
jgi:hypothetical protein